MTKGNEWRLGVPEYSRSSGIIINMKRIWCEGPRHKDKLDRRRGADFQVWSGNNTDGEVKKNSKHRVCILFFEWVFLGECQLKDSTFGRISTCYPCPNLWVINSQISWWVSWSNVASLEKTLRFAHIFDDTLLATQGDAGAHSPSLSHIPLCTFWWANASSKMQQTILY